jgi:predicted transcriptional regulator
MEERQMYQNIRTQTIIEDFNGNLKKYSFTNKEWKVLEKLYFSDNTSIRDLWEKLMLEMGETTVNRTLKKFRKVGWVQDVTLAVRRALMAQNNLLGVNMHLGRNNQKRFYSITPKGIRAYEEFEKKLNDQRRI